MTMNENTNINSYFEETNKEPIELNKESSNETKSVLNNNTTNQEITKTEISQQPIQQLNSTTQKNEVTQNITNNPNIQQQLKLKTIKNKNSNIVLFKDFFDKIGYGFASPLLMYIILYTLGAPIIFIGIIAALKSFLTLFTSSVIKDYNNRVNINRKIVSLYGILFGFSFLMMAFAKSINSEIIFGIGILLSSVFVVIHGDIYSNYVIKMLTSARNHLVSKIISYFGLVITAAAFISAGYLIELNQIKINLYFIQFTIPGYLLILEGIAFAFILSSYVFSFVKSEIIPKKIEEANIGFWKDYFYELKQNFKKFFANHNIKMLFYGNLFFGAMQTFMMTFAAIYIFDNYLGSVTNKIFYLCIIFGIGIIAASIAPNITRKMMRIFGETPLLIFGVFLVSIFPLSIYFNVSYYGLIIANAISIIGSSCISIVQSFIIRNSLQEEERKTYFSAITPSLSIIIPIIIIAMTLIISYVGFRNIFIIIAISTIVLTIPFYFDLVMKANKEHYNRLKNS